ncbi:MAG: trypsin-like peptidase domain-containing protein [Acidobacteriota bacterium]
MRVVLRLILIACVGAGAVEAADPRRPASFGLGKVDRRTPVVRTVERVAPAVVNISTEAAVGRRSVFGMPLGQDRFVENSLGSGVIVDPSGLVVTNAHVIEDASRITVTFLDGRQVLAEVLGVATPYDLALLKVSGDGPYPYLSLDFDEPLYPGETVIAIGNPFGLQSTVTTGVLSSTGRRVVIGETMFSDLLQTDAAINPGNSGGALLTINGDLIGINTQVIAKSENVSFSIPVGRAKKVVEEIVRYGRVRQVWLGFRLNPVLVELGGDSQPVLEVARLLSGAPAHEAGLRAGDLIHAVDGQRVADVDELWTHLSRIAIGSRFELSILRGSQRETLSVLAEALGPERAAGIVSSVLGFTLDQVRHRGRLVTAVSRVRQGSPAWNEGLRQGHSMLACGRSVYADPPSLLMKLALQLLDERVEICVHDGRLAYRVALPTS